MSWGLRGAWGVLGEPRGIILGAWGPPEGAPEGHGGSLGGPWGAPGGSLRHPGGVLRAALGGFGGHLGDQSQKKWPPSNPTTVLDQKRVPKGSPRGSILGGKIDTKSHQNFNAILVAFFSVPGHPPRSKSCIFIGGLFKIEGRPFCAQAVPRSILGAILATKRVPES